MAIWLFAAVIWLCLLAVPLGAWIGWTTADRLCRWHDARKARQRWEATREAREASSRQYWEMVKRAIEMRLKIERELLS